MGFFKWLRSASDDDTEQHETESGAYDTARLPTRQPIDLRRARREQLRSTTGYWRDERGDWHQVRED